MTCRAHLELDPAATGNFWKGDRLPPSPGRTLRRYLQRHLRVAAPAAHPRPAARPRHQRPAAQLRRGGARRLDRRTASPQLRPASTVFGGGCGHSGHDAAHPGLGQPSHGRAGPCGSGAGHCGSSDGHHRVATRQSMPAARYDASEELTEWRRNRRGQPVPRSASKDMPGICHRIRHVSPRSTSHLSVRSQF